MMICHAGSALGEKTNAAMEVCSANAEARAKSKGKGKGKGKGNGKGKAPKCPTVDEIMQMVGEEYAGEICVFTELGWMDEAMNSDDELIQADIETLPNEIAEALSRVRKTFRPSSEQNVGFGTFLTINLTESGNLNAKS